jgi:putative hemolysin
MSEKTPHIVDTLIEERASHLMAKPLLWRTIRPIILPLLGYRRTIEVIDEVGNLPGRQIFQYVSDQLRMNVKTEGIEHIPASGGAVIMPNHPAGIADGIAVFDAVKSIRQDLVFFANRDAVRAAPGLADAIIPVEWVDDKRTHERRKETVKSMVRAFRDQQLVVIFPSGRLAQPTLRGLRERPWQPTAMNLALKYDTPIIPMHIHGGNSWLYYLFYYINQELRDMTLFRELFNKVEAEYRITVAEPFRPGPMMVDHGNDLESMTEHLRQFVAEELPGGSRPFEAPPPGTQKVPAIPEASATGRSRDGDQSMPDSDTTKG